MTYPVPVYIGRLDTMKATDVVDQYINLAPDLIEGESISTVSFTVTGSDGIVVPNVVGAHTETGARTDFRVTAPAAGSYALTAVFTISDGQKLTRVANLTVV